MKNSAFAVLQFRDIRLFLIGNIVSFTGSYMQTVAIAWHVYLLTHSAFFLGLLGIIGFLPTLITFLPAGVLVDKYHKKYLLLFAEFGLGIFAFLLFLFTFLHIITIWILFGILLCSSLCNTLEIPTRNATVPLIVTTEHLSSALNLQTLSRQFGATIGPALAGFCIALYGVQSVYLLNSLSYFFFFGTVLFIIIPRVTAMVEVRKEAILEGIHFVMNNTLLMLSVLLDFFATFFAGAMVLLPIFAKDIYHVNPQELGLLYAAPSVGAIIAGLYISSQKKISHHGKVLIIAIAAYAVGTIGFGLSSWFFLGFLFLTIVGAGDMISTAIRNIIRQKSTPDTLRGRVLSIVMVFFMGGPYLGDAEAGFVAGIFGAPLSVALGGLVTLFVAIGVAWKFPILWLYEDT